MKNINNRKSVYRFILKMGIFAILFLINSGAYAQSPAFIWAKRAGGTELDFGHDIATDMQGNILITGEFEGTTNFGTIPLASSGSSDIFIAKYDSSGNVLWAKRAGGTSLDEGLGITTDNSGNSIIIGFFWGTVNFETTTITSAGSGDIFIAKYDPSGNLLWVKQAGSSGHEEGRDIATDKFGNILAVGYFERTVTFGTTTLVSSGFKDTFIAKYDAFGNVLWAKRAGGTLHDWGNCVTVSEYGNIIVAGSFEGTAYFETTALTSVGQNDLFIAQYNASGTLLWATQAGGEYWDGVNATVTDVSGNIIITGYFYVSITFGPFALTSASLLSEDIFIAKYDIGGNVLWAKRAGGIYQDKVYGIANVGLYKSIITGSFIGTASFGNFSLTSLGGSDFFFAEYDALGNVLWVKQAGGTSYDWGSGITTDYAANIIVAGGFNETATFDATTLVSAGLNDIFIAKFTKSGDLSYFWPVRPTGISQTVLINHATIDEVPIKEGDEIGIFDDTLCVGAALFYGRYPLEVTVWLEATFPDTVLPGATAGNSMGFKIWQKSTDTELLAQPAYTMGSGFFGEELITVDPLEAISLVTQTIPIPHGRLSLISFNILPRDLSIDILMDDLTTLLVARDDRGNYYIPPYGVNSIGDIDLTDGYVLYITGSDDDSMRNDGHPLVPQHYSQVMDNSKLFMIGYPYQNPYPVEDVFASIASSVVVVQDDAGQFWIPSFGVNTIGDMRPGKGYQIFIDQRADFTYPAMDYRVSKKSEPVTELPEPRHFQFQRTGLPYGIVVTISEGALVPGDEVGVFSGRLCVGASAYSGYYPLTIAAWEGDAEFGLRGFKAGEEIHFRIWKASTKQEVGAIGHFTSSSESKFKGGPISIVNLEVLLATRALPTVFAFAQNHPNPFNPTTIINYALPKTCKVSLKIFNLAGQEVGTPLRETQPAGEYELEWNAGTLPSGVYICRLQAGEFIATRKLVLLR